MTDAGRSSGIVRGRIATPHCTHKDFRTYLIIIHGCDEIPGAAVPGARSAVWPDQTSDKQRRNADPGPPSLRVATRKPGCCVARCCVGTATLPPRALPPGFLAATHPAADYEIGSTMPRSLRGATSGRPVKRKPPLSVEALWELQRIGTPTLSPDGGEACSAVTRYDMDKNDSSTSLWLFPTGLARGGTGARARMLTNGDKDSDPKWSPDGRWIAFTAKRKDDDEPQLYVIAPDGGEARRVDEDRDRLRRAEVVSPMAGASRSCPGSGPISPPRRCKPSAARSARKPRSRHTSPSGPSSASGTTGSPTAASRTSSSAMSRPAAAATRSPARASRCRRGSRRPTTTTSRPTAARSRSPSTSPPSRG